MSWPVIACSTEWIMRIADEHDVTYNYKLPLHVDSCMKDFCTEPNVTIYNYVKYEFNKSVPDCFHISILGSVLIIGQEKKQMRK